MTMDFEGVGTSPEISSFYDAAHVRSIGKIGQENLAVQGFGGTGQSSLEQFDQPQRVCSGGPTESQHFPGST
jgi:hypothetical protein